MTRKTKLVTIAVVSGILFIYWVGLFVTGTKGSSINYYWQALLAFAAILFGFFGILTSKHWGWLKSGVGFAVFLISLGLIMWGIGQAGWTYYVLKYPDEEVPAALILDILYFSSIPLWTVGIFKLSKATGAKFGLRTTKGKLLVASVSLVMFIASYYLLVIVARGGNSYFSQPFSDIFWDLGYAIGDAINLTLALVIFGLSWKFLGGKFKRPIIVILLAFAFIYLSDLIFSYRDGLGLYYNGDPSDLLYLATVTTFGIGLSLIDPSKVVSKPIAEHNSTQPTAPVETTSDPQAPLSAEPLPAAPAVVAVAQTEQVAPVPEQNLDAVETPSVQPTEQPLPQEPLAPTTEPTPESPPPTPVKPIIPDSDSSEVYEPPQIGTTIAPQAQDSSAPTDTNLTENPEQNNG